MSMRTTNPKNQNRVRATLFAGVVLVVIAGVGIIVYLWDVCDERFLSLTVGRSISMPPSQPDCRSAVVLLQQSQVQEAKQLVRLNAIDKSWAAWSKPISFDQCGQSIVAALPKASLAHLSRITSIQMLSAGATHRNTEISPYHQYINNLYSILCSSGTTNVGWVVMGNDHSFFVLPNLQAFLATMNVDDLVYTGNELKMMYRARLLSFASGGAGAVLSHAVVKFMLTVWFTTTEEPVLQSILPTIDDSHSPGANYSNDNQLVTPTQCNVAVIAELISCKAQSPMLNMRGSGPEVACLLAYLRLWVRHAEPAVQTATCSEKSQGSSAASMPPQNTLTMRLSSRVRIAYTRTAAPSIDDVTVSLMRRGRWGVAHSIRELRRDCTAHDKWSRTNPGIILAYCIGQVFDIPFTPSTTAAIYATGARTPSVVSRAHEGTAERFNVYGVLRTVLGDYDEWYVDAKRSPAEFNGTSIPILNKGPLLLAKDVVSFHYVSENEATLLYDLLRTHDDEAAQRPIGGGGTIRHSLAPVCRSRFHQMVNCSTAREIRALWPSTGSEAGHYSRPLSRGPHGLHETDLLHDYISHITVADSAPTDNN